jgi:hypothetical protein
MLTQNNRYKIEEHIYAKDTKVYGSSLFAAKDFKKDEVVFVAFGPLITHATTYTIPIGPDLKIDPTQPSGNLCQYICHSCDPSCGIKNRTEIVAMRDIRKDEEITIDYGMIGYEYGGEISEVDRICKCGRSICRGKMGCYKELPREVRKKYKGYISDYLLGMD